MGSRVIGTIVECLGQPIHWTAYRVYERELESRLNSAVYDN